MFILEARYDRARRGGCRKKWPLEVRAGRESLYHLRPEALAPARRYLDAVLRSWDEAIARLRLMVEE